MRATSRTLPRSLDRPGAAGLPAEAGHPGAAPRLLSVPRGLAYAAFAAVSWGTAGAAATLLHQFSGLGPFAITFWRFSLGALLLLAGRIRRLPRWRQLRREWPWLLATAAGMCVFHVCYQTAIVLSGLAVGTAVTLGAAPVLTALAARLLFGERIGRGGATAVLLAVGGLLLLAFGGAGAGTASGGTAPLWGYLAALGSAAGLGATNLLSQFQAQTQAQAGRPGGSGLSAPDRAAGGFAVGVVLLLPVLPFVQLLPTGGRWVEAYGLIAFLGLVPSALAYALMFRSLTVVSATTVTAIAMLEPVAALLLGATLLGERLTAPALAGTGVLLLAVLLLALAERRRPGRPG